MNCTVTDDADDVRAVLVVHNRYQHPGGEDTVVDTEIALLRSVGLEVVTMFAESANAAAMGRVKSRPDRLVFNREAHTAARALIRARRVDLVHCHNLVPLLSTSIYTAAAAEGIPVVQTVHNYRMGCLNGLYLRDSAICEQCRPGWHLPGMALGCYRGSRPQSVAFGATQTINAWRGAWRQPTRYITPGEFLRDRLVAWGIPGEKVIVKPHFAPDDPGVREQERPYALFVGRLSTEKGLDLLLDAWHAERLPLVIAGDGPLRPHLERRVLAERKANVRFAGQQDRDGVHALLDRARFLVMPSVWYETFGLVIIEAYAHGVPVIATALGAMADVVDDNVTGMLFPLNDRAGLGDKLTAMEAPSERYAMMRAAARRAYMERYSAAANVVQLRAIYREARRALATAI